MCGLLLVVSFFVREIACVCGLRWVRVLVSRSFVCGLCDVVVFVLACSCVVLKLV